MPGSGNSQRVRSTAGVLAFSFRSPRCERICSSTAVSIHNANAAAATMMKIPTLPA